MAMVLTPAYCLAPSRQCSENGDSRRDGGDGKRAYRHDRFAAKGDSGSKGCVLVVDDDVSVRETLAELLEDADFRSLRAGDAAEALIILGQNATIDALVTDLTMPGDDGITLIGRARQVRGDLPAILLTGYAEQVTSVTTLAGGNFHVLRKPVESDRLIKQLELLVSKPNG